MVKIIDKLVDHMQVRFDSVGIQRVVRIAGIYSLAEMFRGRPSQERF